MCANQLQIKANELQARHQREEEREVVMTTDECVPTGEKTRCESQAGTLYLNSRGSQCEFSYSCNVIYLLIVTKLLFVMLKKYPKTDQMTYLK